MVLVPGLLYDGGLFVDERLPLITSHACCHEVAGALLDSSQTDIENGSVSCATQLTRLLFLWPRGIFIAPRFSTALNH